LKDVPRKAYYIATKVARYERDFPNMFDFSPETAKISLARSLKLLQLDYVDILEIHDIEFAPNMEIIWTKLLPALEEIRANGQARFIGITGYSLKELKRCIEGAGTRIDMVLSYARNTLFDDSLLEYLPFFKANNLGLVCASVHGMGLLTNSGPQSWHPARQEVKDICRSAAELCKKSNIEMGKLAMYHALQTEGIQTILVGMQTTELVNINLSAVFDGLNKDEMNLYEKLNKLVTRLKLFWNLNNFCFFLYFLVFF
jgi:L-galactose dehydrogenase